MVLETLGGSNMAKVEANISWKIQKATETMAHGAKSFDQHTQGDKPVGPEPKSPPAGAPETS